MSRNKLVCFAAGACFGWLVLTVAIFKSNNVQHVFKEVICEVQVGIPEFSQDALVQKMEEINLRFPHIVLAQALLS